MIDETLEEQAVQYAFGKLNELEAGAFRARLESDEELRRFVRDLEPTVAALALSVRSVAPPPELLGKILGELHPSPALSPRRSAWFPWSLAAGFAIACGVLAVQQQRLQRQLAEVTQHDVLAQMKIAQLSAQVSTYEKVTAVVLWNAERQRGLVDFKLLPRLDAAHDYQLWVIDPARPAPVSAGLINVAADGSARIEFRPTATVPTVKQFALSIEPKGGGPAPRGKIVLAGG